MHNLLVKACHTARLRLLLSPYSPFTSISNVSSSSHSCIIRSLSSVSAVTTGASGNADDSIRKQNTFGRLVFGESLYIQSRNAGHSKWANIKHQKSLVDQKKATEIEKYIRAIRTAAKENKSADPKVNKLLADAIERARAAKVPTSSIQKALEFVARGLNKSGDFKKFTYIMKGPGSCVMIALMETDHVSKLRMDLASVLKKHGFIGGSDSLLHMFDQKGIILCTGQNGKPLTETDLENCVENAIEAEAEEVKWTESPLYGLTMEFTCEAANFYKVCKNLESMNYEIVYSEVDYLPKVLVELDNDQLDLVARFHEKLQAYADVVKIYDNIA